MKRNLMVIGLVVAAAGASFWFGTQGIAAEKAKKECLRVGVYDSRAIAIAYTNSAFSDHLILKVSRQKKEAELKGDLEKVQELENQMQRLQAKRHQQGFGTAPVHELLEPVKDRIEEVAKKSGVDVIVSQWEFDYLAEDAQTVDVTMELAALFQPNEKAYQWIEQMKDKAPIPHEELERLEKEHPH